MDNLMIILLVVGLISLVIYTFVDSRAEKYRKYVIIVLPFIAFLLLYLFKKKKPNDNSSSQSLEFQPSEFQQKIEEVKEDIKEVNTIAEIKRKFSEQKKQEDLKKLDEITKIPDKSERRRKLAEMVG